MKNVKNPAAKNSTYGTGIKYFLLAAVCMLLIPLHSHSDTKGTEQSVVRGAPVQKKQLKTIIVDNYYPYTFVNQEGDPDGFSVDLIKAVAREMGLALKIDVGTWDLACNALKNGAIDFLPMMAYSEERDKFYDFSVPHTIAYDAFFTRKSGSKIRFLNDLRGKKVIVMKNDQAHDYLLSTGLMAPQQLILIDNLPDALRLLSSGKGDAALMPKLVGLIIAKNLNVRNLELSPVIIEDYQRPFSFAVKEGNQPLLERLTQGLNIIKKSDQYSDIYEKWFGALAPSGLSLRTTLKYTAWIIAGFILIASVLILWSFSLKRRVALQTKSLKEEIAERKQVEEALRESEEKFRTIAGSALDAVIMMDPKGNIAYWNPAAERIFGYASEEVMGKNVHGLIMPEKYREQFEHGFKEFGRTGMGFAVGKVLELTTVHKDNHDFPIEIALSSVRMKGEHWSSAIIRDITERKRSEEALRKSEEQLARSRKMESLGLLAGGVAHDLNNILSGIVSYPELLLLDLPEGSNLRKPIKIIEKSGRKASAIVQDLLTVARGVAITKEPLNLNDLVDDYLNSPEFKKLEHLHTMAAVKTNLDTDLLNIAGSHVHLRKAVMNLVSNAAEAVEGRGNVSISTTNIYMDKPPKGYDDVTAGEYAVLSISDDGSGISSDDLERIFEPFYTKKVMGRSGTGLGLAVVWNVVQDHEGYINVKSDGNGTTFELYFPVTRDDILNHDISISINEYKGNAETILVVDDVESQRYISCKMLEKLGYKTQAVSSGEEAVEYLKEHAVDLLLLDMIMDPGINGRETYRRIIEIHPGQKAIIISGFAETDEVQEAQKLGAGRYIKKPVTLKKIGMAVKEELEK